MCRHRNLKSMIKKFIELGDNARPENNIESIEKIKQYCIDSKNEYDSTVDEIIDAILSYRDLFDLEFESDVNLEHGDRFIGDNVYANISVRNGKLTIYDVHLNKSIYALPFSKCGSLDEEFDKNNTIGEWFVMKSHADDAFSKARKLRESFESIFTNAMDICENSIRHLQDAVRQIDEYNKTKNKKGEN